MIKGKVLFIDTTHPLLSQILEEAGFECCHFSFTQKAEYEPVIHDFDVLIIRSKFYIDELFLDKAKKLKIIGRVGSGLENIDLQAAAKRNIKCLNSPEGNRDAVGEHTVGMLLSLNNKLSIADSQVRKGLWIREGNRGNELREKTVGIIGFGNMGSSFAEKLIGFGCKIISYDKYKTQYAPDYVTETDLESLISQSDIISLHVPLTNETEFMIDSNFLKKCKTGVIIINTSRGKILKTSDLVNALKTGKVSGACLDVLEFEDTSFEKAPSQNPVLDWLYQCDKVILTPHIAGWTQESNFKLSKVLAEKIISCYF